MATNSTPRWCEICLREESCHCPAMKSWCGVCVPPLSDQRVPSVAVNAILTRSIMEMDREPVHIPQDAWVAELREIEQRNEAMRRPRVPLVGRMSA